jgi:hypothetical protein
MVVTDASNAEAGARRLEGGVRDSGAAVAISDGGELPAPPRPASYAAVVDILRRSCAYLRCHAGPYVGGGLPLQPGADYASVLVNVPACQYERMKRVEPYHPERSWLMIKLTASFRDADDPYAGYIFFESDPDWDPEQRSCRDATEDGTPLFGQRMPLTAPNMLPESELETIRSWISEGAPFTH